MPRPEYGAKQDVTFYSLSSNFKSRETNMRPDEKKEVDASREKNGGRGTWIKTHAQAALTLVF
jgi:hypothetical protein